MEQEITDDTLVFSRPAQDWSYKAVCKYYAFECPNKAAYIVDEKVNFITFRTTGGEMKRVFRIEERLYMNLQDGYIAFQKNENTPKEKLDRVRGYIKEMRKNTVVSQADLLEEKQIFLFSKEIISLPNRPKPIKRNNSYKCYYRLGDLKQKKAVEPVKI